MDMEENTEEGKYPEKASVQEWFDRHKGVVKLIWLGMALILLLMIFLALRLYGITFMENYAFYASGGSTFLSGGSRITGFDSNATNVTVDNHPDIDGCIRFVTISDEEIDFDAGNADKAVRVDAYWYRFENKTAAREYLNKLGEEKGRKRYVLNEYLFDDPDIDDEATYSSTALSRAAYAAHPFLFGEIVYRAFVAFDFTGFSGM